MPHGSGCGCGPPGAGAMRTAGTGAVVVTTENEELVTVRLSAEGIDLYEQLVLKKYDPVVRKHVNYKESKLS